jgi:K+-transporting ATPase KdpF subunit
MNPAVNPIIVVAGGVAALLFLYLLYALLRPERF